MNWNARALRQAFLNFFQSKGHLLLPSDSLVPKDPSLLFTSAGMVQFKPYFLGVAQPPAPRVTTVQKCLRTTDIESVGDLSHLTFFEMLGNFSFGDYFKREAIRYAWTFLTQELGLPSERLWVTVYEDDDEAAGIWLEEIGVEAARFGRLGAKSNFWSMGDTGPCGPCSEIFYDHGPSVPGGPPGSPDEEGDRYVEIWNLVFMQYNRDGEGRLTPLPKPSVDTGMGLERIAAVMQGVHSNYDTDVFQHLIRAAAGLLGVEDRRHHSLNVIADHIRASAFLVADGVLPSNEGRGYVLRRIVRRAIRHGHRLGARAPFFHALVDPLIEVMGEAYPELAQGRERIVDTLRREEERFGQTLEQGLAILEADLAKLRGDLVPGEVIFKLYDTYGFPVDLLRDIAMERHLRLDMEGFEREMAAQRHRARAASQFKATGLAALEVETPTEFTGYERLTDEGRVVALARAPGAEGEVERVEALREGERGLVVLDRTPFYAESGGQVGDRGWLRTATGAVFRVTDTQKRGAVHVHLGVLERGVLPQGATVQAEVDAARRHATMLNHSATHLMHKALRDVLGPHVQQKGSLVDEHRTRFDFSHPAPLTPDEIAEVERRVNAQILRNVETRARVMKMDEALAAGALAFFGDKYGERVRVLEIGDSIELCGGTHVRRTGDIGLFKIVSESGVAAGVRRIEAVTGLGVYEYLSRTERELNEIAARLHTGREEVPRRLEQLQSRLKTLEKEIEQLRARLATAAAAGGEDLAARAREVKGVNVLAARLDGLDAKALRTALDRYRDRLRPAVVVLASVTDGKVMLVAGLSKDLAGRLHAGELANVVAARVGGKGGGRPDFAQAGGNRPEALDQALGEVAGWVEKRLS